GARPRLLPQREGPGSEAPHDLELSDAERASAGVRDPLSPRARASPGGRRRHRGDHRARIDRLDMTALDGVSAEHELLLLLARCALTPDLQAKARLLARGAISWPRLTR